MNRAAWAALLTALLVATVSAQPARPASASAKPKAVDLKAERARLASSLEALCVKDSPHLNFIRVSVRPAGKGVAMYCVHDLFSRYSLSAGSLGPVMQDWVIDNKPALAAAGVARVGVWGTGDYADGAWFTPR